MRLRTKFWSGTVAMLMAAFLFARFPSIQDVAGTQRIEFFSEVKNPNAINFDHWYVRRTTIISDQEEIQQVCAMIPRIWRSPFDHNSLKDWQERYTLRFVRANGITQIPFTESEWSPCGRTPQTILEWARKKANQSPEPILPAGETELKR